jgi:hypothetical protein
VLLSLGLRLLLSVKAHFLLVEVLLSLDVNFICLLLFLPQALQLHIDMTRHGIVAFRRLVLAWKAARLDLDLQTPFAHTRPLLGANCPLQHRTGSSRMSALTVPFR